MVGSSEAFSRVLIDDALRDSGWDLLDHSRVRFEQQAGGRADYVLLDQHGRTLCVLEAKRESLDPYDAKEQARGYAENLNAPFVLLSNGRIHYFWNYARNEQRDAFRIERLPSPTDLERMRLRNRQPPRPLLTEIVGRDYLQRFNPDRPLRGYQLAALDAIARSFDQHGRRSFLLEMATGTGKTLLCAALIRRFLVTRTAERVLFVVDRIELARQTMEDFEQILREYNPVVFKTARRTGKLLGSSVVVATIQSLITDRRYREEFTPFHFDLVVNDEAHRSIYGDAREVVQFFQATRVGLTATPKAYLRNLDLARLGDENPKALEARQLRDTYAYFGCKPGEPTFRYDIIDAVKDPQGPFLCLPYIKDIRSEITTQALEQKGWTVTIDEQQDSFKIGDLERKVFTPERNQLMCEAFLREAQTDPAGTLGRSIVFAVNQRHATALTKILNQLQPNLAVTITSRVEDASTIAKDFRDGRRPERVAVSVDMLSTGYNCQDLLNVVLMRPIFSPTEYIQIKGRGTRLFTFRLGDTVYDKQKFFLIDFCGVSAYFEDQYDYAAPLRLPRPRPAAVREPGPADPYNPYTEAAPEPPQPRGEHEIPTWTGRDVVVSRELRIVGPDGEKVDVLTFRGSFERDIKQFAAQDPEFSEAVAREDDDAVERILQERFFHRPEFFYAADTLAISYGVPAPPQTFVYSALGRKPLPTKDQVVDDAVDSIAARFDLRYSEQRWVAAVARLIVDDEAAREAFLKHHLAEIVRRPQFAALGGPAQLAKLRQREQIFDALRASPIAQTSLYGVPS